MLKTPLGTAPKPSSNGKSNAWTHHAEALADWALTRLAVRRDVYGAYTPDGGQYTEREPLDRELLNLHFEGRRTIGAHSTSTDNRCLSVTADIDAHDDRADPQANWKCALRAAELLADFGLTPLIADSNGKGGYHVRAFFKKPVASAIAYWLCERIRGFLEAEGHQPPETFPKQAELTLDRPYGNWVRLPGKHHKRDHWTRIWDPSREAWLEAEDAIKRLLKVAGDTPDRLLEVYQVEMDAKQEHAEKDARKGEPSSNGSKRDHDSRSNPDESELRSALDVLPADWCEAYGGSRSECGWLGVGMALHDWDTSRGLALWHEFSSRSTKYESGVCDAKWGTFSASKGGLTVKTIFKEAYGRGWAGPDPKTSTNGSTNGHDHQIYSGKARANGEATPADEPWETPVLDEATPADPFPLEVLPDGLRTYVSEGSRCLTCPVDFLAVAALTVAGATIGRSLAIAIKDTWVESAALYAAFVGKPGASKSPPLALAAKPLWAITEDLIQKHKHDLECLKKDDPKPTLQRIAVNDTTCEALAPILAENPRGVVMVRDELTAWVAGLNQYKSGGKGADRQFFLSAWSGASVTVDRKNQQDRGPIHIPHPFLAVVGAMTPDMLCELSDAKNRDDGFTDRLLFSLPEPVRIRWNNGVIPPEAVEGWNQAVRRLWGRAMYLDDKGRHRPFFVHFTPEALAEYAAWFDSHCEETEQIDFPKHLEGPWSKMRAYCARLALILDRLDRVYDPTGDDRPPEVSLHATRGAIRLINYFKNHCRRVRALLRGVSEENADARAILKWVSTSDRATFSERDARRNFPGRFGDDGPELGRALAWLRGRSCIRLMPLPKKQGSGRPKSPVYEVNPALLENG